MKGLVAAFWVLGISFAVVAAWVAEFFTGRLIDIEYTEFHEQWLADGRPPLGGWDRGEEASYWLSSLSGRFVVLQWLLETPGWVLGHSRAPLLLRRLRISAAAMFSSMLGVFLVMAYHALR